jgi:hypothetical protein
VSRSYHGNHGNYEDDKNPPQPHCSRNARESVGRNARGNGNARWAGLDEGVGLLPSDGNTRSLSRTSRSFSRIDDERLAPGCFRLAAFA